MSEWHTKTITVDGNTYYDLPRTVKLPQEETKYLTADWKEQNTLFKLSYLIYGNVNKYWLLMAANNVTNPYDMPKKFRFLRPEYLGEVSFE